MLKVLKDKIKSLEEFGIKGKDGSRDESILTAGALGVGAAPPGQGMEAVV